ncbi:hypothetical protein [Nostoc sp.]|uniref:hypothetical protein n=1 Tax=Nostoc sp. TaxID=1180 RepID=UPI002FF633BD
MEADDILKGRSLLNRHLYQQRIVDAVEAQLEQQQRTTYLGFDAEQGLARLKAADSNISYGSAQTNGAVGLGDNIRLRRGGVISGYDAMPHHKQKAPSLSTKQEELSAAILFYVRASTLFQDTVASTKSGSVSLNSLTKIHEITLDKITYQDDFVTSFSHFQELDQFAFGNVTLNPGGSIIAGSLDNSPVRFFSPTVAKITVSLNFAPGAAFEIHCGISIDRLVGLFTRNYSPTDTRPVLLISPQNCDVYSNGASINYETTVPPGEHFINCTGCCNFLRPALSSETVSGNISIIVETITTNSFYLQKGSQVTKLEDIVTERKINDNGITATGSLVGYITSTESRILAHIKYAHPIQSNNQFVYRYFLQGTQLTSEKFDYPEAISVLKDDWQQEWTSTYLPDADAQNPCINELKNNGKRRFTNIFKKQIIALNLNQAIDNQPLQNLIKIRNVIAKVEFSSYRSNEGSCTVTPKRTKRLKLNKLIIPANIDIAAVTILGVSVTVK